MKLHTPDDLRRPVGTRVVVRRNGASTQVIGTGTVAAVLQVSPTHGDFCRVEIDYGVDLVIYFRWANELEIAPEPDGAA